MSIAKLTIIAFAVLLFTAFDRVQAHDFSLLLLAPFSQQQGQSELQGFLLATREQDGHEDETSDGHLGGLDSHILQLDSSQGNDALLARLGKSIDGSKLLFASGNLEDRRSREILEQAGVQLVEPQKAVYWNSLSGQPGQIRLMNGGSFAQAYRDRYATDVDIDAIRGYLSARLIARVIRQSNEDQRANPAWLNQAISQSLQRQAP